MSVATLIYIIGGQYLVGMVLRWFPISGYDPDLSVAYRFLALPVLIGVLSGFGGDVRLYRTVFIEETNRDYVRTARAKGAGDIRVMVRHVLRNALIPILTNVAVGLPGIFVGSFLLEVFFSIPGLGRELLLAVNRRDYPVIQAFAVYTAAITMLVNLATDVLYKLVDQRVVLK
jgi:peptide/nickel transport system permease protein